MGRAEALVAAPGEAGSRRASGLSLIRCGTEPPSWTTPGLRSLSRALDLRPTGFRRYEVAAAEARWPAIPGALLAAAGVVAAERSFPGVAVGHLSCSFGPPPQADRPVEVAMSEVHVGKCCITGRLTFRQRSAVYGEATVLLRSLAAEAAAGRLPGSSRSAGAARPTRSQLPAGPAPRWRSQSGICATCVPLATSVRLATPRCGAAFRALPATARSSGLSLPISANCCRSTSAAEFAIRVSRERRGHPPGCSATPSPMPPRSTSGTGCLALSSRPNRGKATSMRSRPSALGRARRSPRFPRPSPFLSEARVSKPGAARAETHPVWFSVSLRREDD
jgi:hypothetical protein